MSDENKTYTVIAAEGAHDVETFSKILRIKGFHEIKSLKDVPDDLRPLIPTRYPWKNNGTELNRLVAHPSFLVKEDHWILLSNAEGETKLAANLKEILTVPRKEYAEKRLRGAAILADADTKTAEEKKNGIFRQLAGAFSDSDNLAFHPDEPAQIELYGTARPFGVYIFPDDQRQGTLEDILIEGAGRQYPELLKEAQAYIERAERLTYTKLFQPKSESDRKKATVGVIANALRPGKANQVSIHDNDWFTQDSLSALPSHQSLSRFIDQVIGWNEV